MLRQAHDQPGVPGAAVAAGSATLEGSYTECRLLTLSHYCNFVNCAGIMNRKTILQQILLITLKYLVSTYNINR